MKRVFLTLVYFAVFHAVLMTGFVAGFLIRPAAPGVVSDRKQDDCTCAVCLPDHFCTKCGHKSRDCPRLSWYFHPNTNILFKVKLPGEK